MLFAFLFQHIRQLFFEELTFRKMTQIAFFPFKRADFLLDKVKQRSNNFVSLSILVGENWGVVFVCVVVTSLRLG